MATVKYFLKGGNLKRKSEPVTIYVRLRDGRKTDITVSTGYLISPLYWSSSNGKVKQSSENKEKLNLANKLENLQRKIFDSLNLEKSSGISINKKWLEFLIQRFKNPLLEERTDYLIELLRSYQNELKNKVNKRTGRKTSSGTIKNFDTTISRITKYENKKNIRLNTLDIDLTFHSDYVSFATDQLGLSINSIGKDLKQIKTVCLDTRDKGFGINKQVESRKFNAPSEPTLFVTLAEDEIERIKETDLKGANYLENARDWLIIGCWTGCRVNDLMKLTKENILLTKEGKKFIRYIQSKTGKQVDLPIHDHVYQIINRLNGLPRSISDVKFNKYIKEVCELSGLTDEVHGTKQNKFTHKKEVGYFKKYELVRSHTCRRSFATNHYNKLPNKLIMAVTGHATERMLLAYIGETENDHIDDFLNVWNSEKEEKKKIIKFNV